MIYRIGIYNKNNELLEICYNKEDNLIDFLERLSLYNNIFNDCYGKLISIIQ